jgi:hypothetical protein
VRLSWIVGGPLAIVALALSTYWFARSEATPPAAAAPANASTEAAPDARPAAGPITTAAVGAAGDGQPGAQIQAPPVASAPAGKTGIQVVWRGATAVPCSLYDESGTKALSPQGFASFWECSSGMGLWDAAPGKYQVKVEGVADTMPPVPVTVSRGQVAVVEPRVGRLRLHWNGSNAVAWYLLDSTGDRTLSPQGFSSTWYCDPGQVCTRDLGPGTYFVRVDAPGYQLVKLTIAPFRVTDVTIP